MQSVPDIAAQHARMVECAIVSGEPAKAHAAIDRAFSVIGEIDQLTLDSRLDTVISLRIASILEAAGVETIGQLISHSRDELAKINQIRYRSVDLVEIAIARHGFRLRRDHAGETSL